MTDFYKIKIACSNCYKRTKYNIPVGINVNYFKTGVICNKCGCKI